MKKKNYLHFLYIITTVRKIIINGHTDENEKVIMPFDFDNGNFDCATACLCPDERLTFSLVAPKKNPLKK